MSLAFTPCAWWNFHISIITDNYVSIVRDRAIQQSILCHYQFRSYQEEFRYWLSLQMLTILFFIFYYSTLSSTKWVWGWLIGYRRSAIPGRYKCKWWIVCHLRDLGGCQCGYQVHRPFWSSFEEGCCHFHFCSHSESWRILQLSEVICVILLCDPNLDDVALDLDQ